MQKLYRYYLLTVFGAMYMTAYLPLYYLLVVKKDYRKAQKVRQGFVKRIFSITGLRYDLIGGEGIDFNKTYIICCNHASYLDIPALLAAIPAYFGFMGKAELMDIKLIRVFFKTIDIPVDRENRVRSAASYKRSLKALQEGRSLVIFPEGGIYGDPLILDEFKDGAFQLAVRQNIPILPIVMPDNWRIFPDGKGLAKAGKIRLILHQPLEAGSDAGDLKSKVYRILQDDLTRYNS